ncbi:MAG: sulfatase-like hydrolase/transferase [Holophagaceae bacterium]|uniref:Sulfatase-like hydrolase/transferase n=1 Tax=Candidatus Geothrix skivensis TaxID=2954439 RepID=A0A9D7SHU7_9BACT|nr:sulfatase-like hydrolase/transferase [Candidatus Geothrix skivensis]
MNPSRFLKCFSLANLIFLPAWVEMMPGAGQRYYMGYSVDGVALAALGASLLLTALVLHLAYRWLEHRTGWWGRLLRQAGLFLVTGLAINGLRVGLPIQAYVFDLANQVMQLGWTRFLLFYGSPFVLLALFIHFKEERFSHWGARLLLVLCPLPLVTGSTFFTTPKPMEALAPATGIAPVRPKGLTVYMIFDEWDYNWTYPYRPANIPLPELDRFGRENLFFTHAYAPTSETFRSIPSLLTGRIVEQARTTTGPDALLRFRGEATWTPWSQVPDLPYLLGQQGLRTCFITHYHAFGPAHALARPTLEIKRKPYFREWEEGKHRYQTFAGSMLRQGRAVLENVPGVNFLLNHEGKVQSVPTAYLHALEETLAALRSRRFDAIIVHWPIPTPPSWWIPPRAISRRTPPRASG